MAVEQSFGPTSGAEPSFEHFMQQTTFLLYLDGLAPAWYQSLVTCNQNQLELASCHRCSWADEMLTLVITECMALDDAWSNYLDEDDLILLSV